MFWTYFKHALINEQELLIYYAIIYDMSVTIHDMKTFQ